MKATEKTLSEPIKTIRIMWDSLLKGGDVIDH